ncbi:unnamed protein product [Discosporangium mesarthrocarpum]
MPRESALALVDKSRRGATLQQGKFLRVTPLAGKAVSGVTQAPQGTARLPPRHYSCEQHEVSDKPQRLPQTHVLCCTCPVRTAPILGNPCVPCDVVFCGKYTRVKNTLQSEPRNRIKNTVTHARNWQGGRVPGGQPEGGVYPKRPQLELEWGPLQGGRDNPPGTRSEGE